MSKNPRQMKETESYKMVKFIDEGAFASVFEVIKKDEPDSRYALKMIKANNKQAYMEKQLEQEVIFHAVYLPSHPNILCAFDIFRTDNYVCFVMDYCTCTLQDIINKDDVPLWFKMRVTRQLAAGLDSLFQRSIIHRDLKPKNILLSGDNYENYQIKITDFGLSKRLDPSQVLATSAVGTPLYMAPQILNNEKFGIDVDVWALGCLIYTLFTKRPPFNAQSFPQLMDMLKKGDYFIPRGTDIPFEAICFIDTCLKDKPSDRAPTFQLIYHEFVTTHDEKDLHRAKILSNKDLWLNTKRDNSSFLLKTQNEEII